MVEHPDYIGEVGGSYKFIAGVAQLVEQLICNQQVAGSSPIASSKNPEEIRGFLFLNLIVVEHPDCIGKACPNEPVAESAVDGF